MKEYYASKSKFLFLLVLSGAMPLFIAFAMFNTKHFAGSLFPLLILGFVGFLFYLQIKRISHPILHIQNNKITLITKFFKTKVINDLKNSKLVISNDFVAFRERGKQDISVSKDEFPKKNMGNSVN